MAKIKTGKVSKCTSCGNSFWLTSIELLFYVLRELPSPTECRACLRIGRPVDDELNPSPRVVNS